MGTPSAPSEDLPHPPQRRKGPAGPTGLQPIKEPHTFPGPESSTDPAGPEPLTEPADATSTSATTKKTLLQRAISNPTDEEKEEMARNYSEKSIQTGFISKVYGILLCQLSITVGFICIFIFHPDGETFVNDNKWLLWISIIIALATLAPMVYDKSLRSKLPFNLIILFIFTLFMSVVAGWLSAYFQVKVVLVAVGLTAGVILLLTIFAIQTKIDYTPWRAVCLCLLFMLMVFGFILIFWITSDDSHQNPHKKNEPVLQFVYGSLGALFLSLYLIYNTEMMIGGGHKYSIEPEEYIFAALALYLDVVGIFLLIVYIPYRIVMTCSPWLKSGRG